MDLNDLVKPDIERPIVSVSINNDDEYTFIEAVQLTIRASDNGTGVYQMCIANNWDLHDGIWEGYKETKDWTLLPGSGKKTVYIKVKDKAGNISETAAITIEVDLLAGKVITSISKAVNWLLSQQTQGSDINAKEYGSGYSSPELTSLAVLALCNQGQTIHDPSQPQNAVDRGIRYIIRNISGINPAAGNFLIHSQWDYNSIVGQRMTEDDIISGVKTFGGFGDGIPLSVANNSSIQFALLGIKIAKDFLAQSPYSSMQLELPVTFYRNLIVWLSNTFDVTSGGFGYSSRPPTPLTSAAVLCCLPLFYNECGAYAPATIC